MKKLLVAIIFLLSMHVVVAQQGPPWYFINTGLDYQHVILVQPTVSITIDGVSVDQGDYIGAFYKVGDTLICGSGVGMTGDAGGYIYSEISSTGAAVVCWGAEPNVSNGFQDGEVFKWKIWRASDGSTLDAKAEYFSPAQMGPPFDADSMYHANSFSALKSLAAETEPGIDISLNYQYTPLSDCALSDSEVVSVQIGNQDTLPIYDFSVNYTINGADTVSEFITDTIPGGGAMDYTFSINADLSQVGSYTFKCWVNISGDVNTSNDYNIYNVTNFESPVVNLGNDTSICESDAPLYVLPDNLDWVSYLWDNGFTTPHNALYNGSYSITVTDVNGCIAVDTITIEFYPDPLFDLQDTVEFCEGSSGIISVSDRYQEIEWSTNSSNASIEVSEPGFYQVTVTDFIGCTASDSVLAIQIEQPMVSLGEDLFISSLDTIVLSAGSGFDTYLWNTGEINSQIQPLSFGAYSVTVWDGECTGTDEINISYYDSLDNFSELILYPNPATEFINILHHNSQNGRLDIYDAVGKHIKSFEYSSKGLVPIDIRHLRHGVYIFRINTGKETYIRRILKA